MPEGFDFEGGDYSLNELKGGTDSVASLGERIYGAAGQQSVDSTLGGNAINMHAQTGGRRRKSKSVGKNGKKGNKGNKGKTGGKGSKKRTTRRRRSSKSKSPKVGGRRRKKSATKKH